MDFNINVTPGGEECTAVFTGFVQTGDRISISEALKMHDISSEEAVGMPVTVFAILRKKAGGEDR